MDFGSGGSRKSLQVSGLRLPRCVTIFPNISHWATLKGGLSHLETLVP